MVTPDTVSDRV